MRIMTDDGATFDAPDSIRSLPLAIPLAPMPSTLHSIPSYYPYHETLIPSNLTEDLGMDRYLAISIESFVAHISKTNNDDPTKCLDDLQRVERYLQNEIRRLIHAGAHY